MLLPILPRTDVDLVPNLWHEGPKDTVTMLLTVFTVAFVRVAIGPPEACKLLYAHKGLAILRYGSEAIQFPVFPSSTVQMELLRVWR